MSAGGWLFFLGSSILICFLSAKPDKLTMSAKVDNLKTTKGTQMSTTAITNQLTIIYSGIKLPKGGMFTDILKETFFDEVSEMEWIEEKIRQINLYPENWGASYSFQRV